MNALRKRDWILAVLALSLLTAIIYGPAVKYGFVHYDDPQILLDNTAVHEFNLARIFGGPLASDYVPLTLFTYALEHRAAGLSPWLYHLDNALLFCLNGILVFIFVALLTGEKRIAFIVSLLFAAHPLHVESVAWVTERKDVLSGALALGSLITCVLFVRTGDRRIAAAHGVLYILALLAKPSLLILSVLFLMIFLFSGRARMKSTAAFAVFWFAAAAATLLNRLQVHDEDYVLNRAIPGFIERLRFAGEALVFYFSKMLLPTRLSVIYERGVAGVEAWRYGIAALGAGFLLWRARHLSRRKLIMFGLLFAAVCLAPSLQLISFGNKIGFADRYAYLALLGLALAFAAAVPSNRIADAAFAAVILVFAGLSIARVSVWSGDLRLWSDAYGKYPDSSIAANNLGLSYLDAGDGQRGADMIQTAIRLDPTHISSYLNLVVLDFNRNNLDEAETRALEALKIAPANPQIQSWVNRLIQARAERGEKGRASKLSAEARSIIQKEVKP